jgi:hypothetical protein
MRRDTKVTLTTAKSVEFRVFNTIVAGRKYDEYRWPISQRMRGLRSPKEKKNLFSRRNRPPAGQGSIRPFSSFTILTFITTQICSKEVAVYSRLDQLKFGL